ncbi:hypothetical protein E1162_10075 [Rhodobacteraceae bacterium RKSG542]|uniref:heparin lyase I family protein n=1 Tax=Pseudovibrio flavus TaxID=2529854 RepID=UPI0012BBABD0|nr:heparin lyase I family protein [Pseudovibrio flavus]MTI17585.1 hypothetical protein [Pseudovibrio flavus]
MFVSSVKTFPLRSAVFGSISAFAALFLAGGYVFAQQNSQPIDSAPNVEAPAEELVVETPQDRSGTCETILEDFAKPLSPKNWLTKRMVPKEDFTLQGINVREGGQALAISITGDDIVDAEGKLKHEIWEANEKRCNFGDEVWYSFSFLIKGTVWRSGSTRWVIGQWKEESGGSPFLAQRYDNGVFHITVQHNDKRLLVAKSDGDQYLDFDRFSNEMKQLLLLDDYGFRKKEDASISYEDYLDQQLRRSEFNKAIQTQNVKAFPFLTDKEKYSQDPDVKIEISANPNLPDPSKGWVDMRYRIKGDRKGGALIEIWANGNFIARVTGSVGNDDFTGPTQYFKFGHYRDPDRKDLDSVVYLDRFKRGPKRSDVD